MKKYLFTNVSFTEYRKVYRSKKGVFLEVNRPKQARQTARGGYFTLYLDAQSAGPALESAQKAQALKPLSACSHDTRYERAGLGPGACITAHSGRGTAAGGDYDDRTISLASLIVIIS